MRFALVLVFVGLVTTANAEGWLCVADSAAGFRYNKQTQQWDAQTFKADSRFVIKRQSADSVFKKVAWVFQEVGQKNETGACKEDFDDQGYLKCFSFVGELTFRKETLRFIMKSNADYFLTDKERDDIRDVLKTELDARDDMGVEIGRCTPL